MPILTLVSCAAAMAGGDDTQFYKFRETLSARAAIERVVEQVCGIPEGLPRFVWTSRCADVVKDDPTSETCMVASEHGYAFVSWNMLGGTNVVFNRWD